MAATHEQLATRQLVTGLFDAAALLDAHDRPVVTNEGFNRLVGLNARRIQRAVEAGMTTLQMLNSAGPELADGLHTCRETLRPVRLVELIATNAQGEPFSVWVTYIPVLSASGELDAVVQVIRDVTAEVRVQAHFRELLRESQGRAEELERVVATRTHELRAALDQVTLLSRTDPLTGALNRRAFDELANHALSLMLRHPERGLGILMCDLDYFKKLNDGFGHGAGDAMLIATSKTLASTVRAGDCVARFGGEEFVVLLSEVSHEGLGLVGERCCAAIRDLPFGDIVPGKKEPQTVSIGGAWAPLHGQTIDALLHAADEALYKAKQSGRNQYRSAE